MSEIWKKCDHEWKEKVDSQLKQSQDNAEERAESAEQQLAELKAGYAGAVEAAAICESTANVMRNSTSKEEKAKTMVLDNCARAIRSLAPQSIQDILAVLEAAKAWSIKNKENTMDKFGLALYEAVRKMEKQP